MFCSFRVILSLCAKPFDYRSIGVTCGQYKDKEEKTLKKTKKDPKNVKNENFEKQKKSFFHIAPKIIFSENYVPRSKTVTCSLVTDTQTNRQKSKNRGSPFRAIGVPRFSP